MDTEFKKRLADYFSGDESSILLNLLDISVEELIIMFEDRVEEYRDVLEEFMYDGR